MKDKKFLLIMVPVIIILFTFVSYALIPIFNQNITEDNIIHLLEKSANDTISFLSNDGSDNNTVESENVTSQPVQNRTYTSNGATTSANDNSGGNTATSDSQETTTPEQSAQGESEGNSPSPQPETPTVPEPASQESGGENTNQQQ